MKVLYIVHTTEWAGSTISFFNMIKGLATKGVQVSIAGPKPSGAFKDEVNKLSLHYYIIKIAESVYPVYDIKWPLRFLNLLRRKRLFYRQLLKVALYVQPDLIHTNVGTLHEGLSVAEKIGVPHVWHLREYQDKDFGWHIYPSKLAFIKELSHSAVITITDDIRRHFKLNETEYAKTIYNGVVCAEHQSDISDKDNYFLCANRVSKEKGMEDVVKAFADFHNKNSSFRLKILGEGEKHYIQHLKKIAKDYDCATAIDWLGFKKDVTPYMKYARALIVASKFEGFGRMTAEACAAGCLVVGRDTGGTKEILTKTGGFLFEDVHGLSNAMQLVSNLDKSKYNIMAQKAQEKAFNLYSISQNVNNVYQFYMKIIKQLEPNE